MDWKNINNYFDDISGKFLKELFEDSPFPWSPLSRLTEKIEAFFVGVKTSGEIKSESTVLKNRDGSFKEGVYHIKESEITTEDFIDPELKIFIGKGTFLETGAAIKNHTIIENDCEVRQGAYLRGYSYIGPQSVVGHTTEIKNSIFIRNVASCHFNYVGDSIVGSFVNLGAGTKISNLELRSMQAKREEFFPEIKMVIDKQTINTGLSKFGSIIGDGCETGCNSTLSPAVLLKPKCWVLPHVCVQKGVYERSILRNETFSETASTAVEHCKR